MPKCYSCFVKIDDIKIFSTHVGHHGLRSKRIPCVEDACIHKPIEKRLYSTFSAFLRHYRHIHSGNTRQLDQDQPSACPKSAEPIQSPMEVDPPPDDPNLDTDPFQVTDTSNINLVKAELDLFIARLYYDYKIPRSTVQSVVKSAESLISVVHSFLDPILSPIVQECTNKDALMELQELMKYLSNPFQEIHSEYSRIKTYTKQGTFIPPETYEIGQALAASPECITEVLTAQFIPLRQTLKAFLEEPDVMKKILEFKESIKNSPFLLNFMNGEEWKRIEMSVNKFILPLWLYNDDFCPNNALGDSPAVQKITTLYVQMPFLPTEYISSLHHIFLLYLHYSLEKKTISNQDLYFKIVEEFKYLFNEGISVETECYTGKVYFGLGLLTGDNLGLHEIAGFVKGFRANYPCRYCKMKLSDLVVCCIEDPTLRRNIVNYNTDLTTNDPSKTGIREDCIFHVIPLFHCTTNIGCDILHDIFEGSCRYDLPLVLDYFRKRKYFNLEELNNRMKTFDYGPIDKNSIPPLLEVENGKIKIKMSAHHMMIFTKYLGILIGDLIPEGHEVWRLYIILRKIIDICMCPHIPKKFLPLLSSLVTEHHELYLKWSDDKQLKNKHHHMLHYAWVIENHGPLVHQWTFRTEARHRIGKSIAVSISTWVNLPASIALRNQLGFHALLKSHSFLNFNFESSRQRPCIFEELEFYEKIRDQIPEDLQDGHLVSMICIHGTKYKEGMVLVLGYHNLLPMFAYVEKIVSQSANAYFLCSKLTTEYFDEHFYAYNVEFTPNSYLFVKYSDLPHKFPTCISKVSGSGEFFVTYRHAL